MTLELIKGKNIILGQNNCRKVILYLQLILLKGEKYSLKSFDDKFYFKDNTNLYIILKCLIVQMLIENI